jgi:ribosome-binding factor A
MRSFKRSDRLSEQILRDISSMMEYVLGDQLSSLVTFTHVKLSSDLKYATVYYSYFGNKETPESVQQFLERAKSKIRHDLGQKLKIRRIPELTFKFDPSIEEGIRIEQLLSEIKSNDNSK